MFNLGAMQFVNVRNMEFYQHDSSWVILLIVIIVLSMEELSYSELIVLFPFLIDEICGFWNMSNLSF